MEKNKWNTISINALGNQYDNYHGFEIITKKSGNRNRKRIYLKFICSKCSEAYRVELHSVEIRKGDLCKKCTTSITGNNRKHSFDYVKALFKEKGFTLIEGEYRGNADKMTSLNQEGYKVQISYNNLLKGYIPLVFSMHNKHTISNIRKFLDKHEPNYEILSEVFVRADGSKLLWRCDSGHRYRADWNSFRNGSRCPECELEGRFGVYSVSTVVGNKTEWINIDAKLYLIKCTNKHEEFYKIGITTLSIEERFPSSAKMPYSYKILKQIDTNLYKAIHLEKELHDMHKRYSYAPILEFGGHTECFSEVDIKYISKLASY